MKNRLKSVLYICFVVVLSLSCENGDSISMFDLGKSSKLNLGPTIDLTNETIPTSGKKVVINNPSSEIDGFTLEIPANSYKNSRNLKISTAEIISHNFGENVNPVTPLITIQNGGGYSDHVLFLKIPCKIPKDKYPVGFYFDSELNKLEAIPIVNYTDSSITLATRHFTTSSLSAQKSSGKATSILNEESFSQIFVSIINKAKLENIGEINTGYTPGVDDWEFTNWGSYLTEGNCAGMVISSMWYYCQKKESEKKNLFHLLDKYVKSAEVDPLEADNYLGLRFCTKIQIEQGLNLDQIYYEYYARVQQELSGYPDFFTAYSQMGWYLVAASMLMNPEPHYFWVSKGLNKGDPNHAIIGYAISYNEGKIKVADPNNPGDKSRFISFNNGKLNSYESKNNAGAAPTSYDKIAFYSKSALINWENLDFHWTSVKNGSIGNDIYPEINLTYFDKDGKEQDLPDALPFSENNPYKIACLATPKDGKPAFNAGMRLWFYNEKNKLEKGKEIISGEQYLEFTIDKSYSNCDLGIEIFKYEGGYYKFIGFKWVKIQDLLISPQKMYGTSDVEYTWTAELANPPGKARYEWNFGDGTGTQTVRNTTTMKHTYKSNGIFPIILSLYDDSNGNPMGVATGYAYIGNSTVIDTSFTINMSGVYYEDGSPQINVVAKGSLSAKSILLKRIKSSIDVPIYEYTGKVPSEISAEITFQLSFPKTHFKGGKDDNDEWAETDYSLEKSNIWVNTNINYLPGVSNISVDTSGWRFKCKANLTKSGYTLWGNDMFCKYNRKITYYKKDGTVKEVKYVNATTEQIFYFDITFSP